MAAPIVPVAPITKIFIDGPSLLNRRVEDWHTAGIRRHRSD
jgi:hypothetical protein